MQRGPYTKRNVRADAREARLKGLGYSSYSTYLGSPAWRDVKRRYAEVCPMVCMCGDTATQIHHTTYERVGRERIDDLVALCRACHQHAHALEAAGVIDLDLDGFYYDRFQAAEYAPAVAARKAEVAADLEAALVAQAEERARIEAERARRKAQSPRTLKRAERGRALRKTA